MIRLTTSKSPSATIEPPAGATGATVSSTPGVLAAAGAAVAEGAGALVAVGATGTSVAEGSASAVSGSRVAGSAVADSCGVVVATASTDVTVDSTSSGAEGSTTGSVVANGDDCPVSGWRRTGGTARGGVVATGPEATCALSGAEEQLVIKRSATTHAALRRYFALTGTNRSSSNRPCHRGKERSTPGTAAHRHHANRQVP